MPRSDRLLELAQLLAGRRPRTLQELVDRFDISPRTAYRDLADLSRRNIPVTRDERGYRLLETASLRPLGLTTAERAILRLALDNPSLRRQPSLAKALDLLRAKLDAANAELAETPRGLWLAGPDRSGRVAPGVIDTLTGCALVARSVAIDYASLAGKRRSWRGVDPYYVFHRSEAWYLLGRCHVHDEPRIFRLDRIAAVRPQDAGFTPPAVDLASYLESCWGVYRGRKSHQVVLRFAAEVAPLIEHGRHHEAETLTRLAGGEIEYRVRLSHLEEVARWVLGFGGRCVVVEPRELRRRVLHLTQGVADAHGERPLAPPGRGGARGQRKVIRAVRTQHDGR